MKKKLAVILLVFIMAFLCGCSGRLKARNLNEIKTGISKAGYKQDTMSEYQGDLSTMGCLINNRWTFIFFDYGKDKEGLDSFVSMMDLVTDTAVTAYGSNYTIYEGMNDTNYWIYVRVDNTWLEVFGPKQEKEQIKTFVKDLGYYKD